MGINSDICFDLFTSYPIKEYVPMVSDSIGVGVLVLGLVYVLNAGLTIYWIKQQQRNALLGMEGAAKNVIFPVYLPFMWMSAFADLLVGVIIMFVKINIVGENSFASAAAAASLFAVQHFVLEGVAFALVQYGCGFQAAKNATTWSVGWAAITFLAQFIIFHQGDTEQAFFVICVWNSVLLLFYLLLWLAPKKALFRRAAIIYYARFWVVYRSMFFLSEILVHERDDHPWLVLAGNCMFTFGLLLLFLLFKPFIVYKSLLLDSKWWQGVAGRGNIRSSAPSARSRSRRGVGGYGYQCAGSGDIADYDDDDDDNDDDDDDDDADADGSSAGDNDGGWWCWGGKGGAETKGDAWGVKARTAWTFRRVLGVLDGDGHGDDKPGRRVVNAPPSASADNRHDYDAIHHPLLGMEIGFDDAQQLANEVDKIRFEGTVKLLNFAYISLDKVSRARSSSDAVRALGEGGVSGGGGGGGAASSGTGMGAASSGSNNTNRTVLGAGSFSKVYAGKYRGLPVAIKMLFTQELNPEIIKRCHNEARILSELSPHPNVVNIYGVAVLPPSVCLVLEICEYGSLSDVLRGVHGAGVYRQPLSLTTADRMFLALGCARGVQALHEYSADLRHRDVKSFNFLIDAQLNAKIADLELGVIKKKYGGDRREKPIATSGGGAHAETSGTSHGTGSAYGSSPGGGLGTAAEAAMGLSPPAGLQSGSTEPTLLREDLGMNITWQAPEVLLGQPYTQKSDVYSLALVLWEIIAARTTKYYGSSGMDGKYDQRNAEDLNSNQYAFSKGGYASPVRGTSRSSSRTLSSSLLGGNSTSVEGQSQMSLASSPGASFLLGVAGYHNSHDLTGLNSSPGMGAPVSNSIPFNECSSQFNVKEKIVLGYRPSLPSAMTYDLSPIYVKIITQAWQADPSARPSAAWIANQLVCCWEHCAHKSIYATKHIVDFDTLQEENLKMSILADFRSGGGAGLGGYHVGRSTGCRPMPGLGGTWGGKAARSGVAESGIGGVGGGRGAGGFAAEGQSVMSTRAPPSASVLSMLSQLQLEPNWQRLEQQDCGVPGVGSGAFLVVTAQSPFYIVWATKAWTYLTGYLLNDALACDVTVLKGPRTNFPLLQEALSATRWGATQHIVTPIYCRDGRPSICSIHMFPVFDGSRGATSVSKSAPVVSRDELVGGGGV